jgi:hypothetical protein
MKERTEGLLVEIRFGSYSKFELQGPFKVLIFERTTFGKMMNDF